MKANSARLGLCITVLIFTFALSAKSMQANWMRSFGTEADVYCKAVTTDTNGNIYMAGWFSGSALQFNETTLYKSNSNDTTQDIFVAKFDSTGFCQWASNFGGDGADFINDILVDSEGKVFICGDFYSSEISFGNTKLLNHSKILSSVLITADFYIAALDEAGNPLWAACGGGVYDDFAVDMTFDSRQNILLAANFRSYSISLGGIAVSNAATSDSNLETTDDMLLCKLTREGEILWLKQYGGRSSETIKSLVSDKADNIYLAGNYSGTEIKLEAMSVTKTTEDLDIWFAKVDASGNPIWLKTLGEKGEDEAANIALDPAGNIYLTGSFNSSWLDFHPGIIRNNCLDQSSYNSFLAKYDPQGEIIWVKAIGGTSNDFTDEVLVLNSDLIIVSCSVQSSKIAIDSTCVNVQTNDLSPDCLFLGFNGSGKIIASAQVGGNEVDFPTSMACSDSENVIVTGVFGSQVIYYSDTAVSNIDLEGSDIFMIKYKFGEIP